MRLGREEDETRHSTQSPHAGFLQLPSRRRHPRSFPIPSHPMAAAPRALSSPPPRIHFISPNSNHSDRGSDRRETPPSTAAVWPHGHATPSMTVFG